MVKYHYLFILLNIQYLVKMGTLKLNERYFLVFFNAIQDSMFGQKPVAGFFESRTENGSYLNRHKVIRSIEQKGGKEVIITNIIELNEDEYLDWIAR
jgi:hypothetical protein